MIWGIYRLIERHVSPVLCENREGLGLPHETMSTDDPCSPHQTLQRTVYTNNPQYHLDD